VHLQSSNLVRLSLPLLAHADPDVRGQVYVLLHCAYGGSLLPALERLAQDRDVQVRRQAAIALEAVGAEGIHTDPEPQPYGALPVTCLGALRVFAGDRWLEPRDWSPDAGGRAGWQKVQGIFAFLLHCGVHGTTRDALAEAVWGGPSSASSLSRTLTTLRGTLARAAGETFAEQALLCAGELCRLEPDLFDCDAPVFERAFNLAADLEHAEGLLAAAPLYAQAVDLYGGPYMADVLPGSGWMLPRRELLTSYFVNASERLAAAAYERGDDRRCVQICLQALDAEPAADDLITWALRAYARLGLYGESETVYRSYLRAAGINPEDADADQDPVVETYIQLTRTRAVNE
jgi:DNA-binding SARP family transcriptional activator